MGKIKKILENELVGGTQSTDVYPVTSTKAVYDTNNKVLDDYIQHLKKTSTFAGIATPTTNPGTPDGPVFYIAGEGTYANFSNIVIEAGQLGILKWNGTWSKEVLEIGAGGGTAILSEYSWWGRKFEPESNSITGEMSGVTGIEFQSTNGETVIRKKLHLDNNGDLCFNGNFYATGGITALGSSGGTSGGSGVSLGTLLAQLNNENPFPTANGQVLTYNGSNFVWKTPTGSGGSGVTLSPVMTAMNNQLGKTTLNTPQFLYWDGSTYTWKNESEISGGSGSSSRIKKIKLFTNNSDYPFETIDLGTADTIGFMQGNNITFQAVVKDFTNVIKISATGGSGGSSGGSTSTSVSWEDVTGKPSTFTPSSHTHSTNEINGLSNYVQGVKVNNATNADKATQLANPRAIWGQSFNGTSNINGNLYMGTEGGGSIQLWMNNSNMLDRTNNTLHIGNGLKESSDGEINFDAYATKIYTDNMSKHYDFKSNVFDVNSNQIHFGSETNGGKIYWDAANNAFKIEGNVYATGGITALGVSNNATTSNNVDFTFRSVTSKRNIIYAYDDNPFKIYPKNNTDNSLTFNHNGNNWNIYDENLENLRLQGNCIIDSDGWVHSPQFLGEYCKMSLDDYNFRLGDENTDATVVFYYNGSSYKLNMSKAISIEVFTKLSKQELSTLQARMIKKKAVS